MIIIHFHISNVIISGKLLPDGKGFCHGDDYEGSIGGHRSFEAVYVNHRYTDNEVHTMNQYQAATYLPSNNVCYRKFLVSTQSEYVEWERWFLFIVIGFLTGMTGFFLHLVVEYALDKKWEYVLQLNLEGKNKMWIYGFLVGTSVLLVAASTSLVVFYRPSAGGSGMPQLIAYLNGTMVQGFLSFHTFVAKFLSCTLAVSSSMTIGPEGPMIHMGAIIGSCISNFRLFGRDIMRFRRFCNTKDKRDFISGGSAAGIASAFSAPIGGLLFAMEEVTSLWNLDLGWNVFLCCIASACTSIIFNSYFISRHPNNEVFGFFSPQASIIMSYTKAIKVHIIALIPCAFLGMIGGFFGSMFVIINTQVVRLRKNFLDSIKNEFLRKLVAALEPIIIVILTITFTFFAPYVSKGCKMVHCKMVAKNFFEVKPRLIEDLKLMERIDCFYIDTDAGEHTETNTWVAVPVTPKGYVPFDCRGVVKPTGNWSLQPKDFKLGEGEVRFDYEYNELASIMFKSGFNTVRLMMTRATFHHFLPMNLGLVFVIYFLLVIWSAGTAVSSGIFIPMMYCGSLFGRMFGQVISHFLNQYVYPDMEAETSPWWDPGAMAMLGSVAFLAGFSRLTLCLAVMMMEMTNDIQSLLLLLIVICFSRCFGDQMAHPYYHAVLEVLAIPFLHWLPTPHISHRGKPLNMEMYKGKVSFSILSWGSNVELQ